METAIVAKVGPGLGSYRSRASAKNFRHSRLLSPEEIIMFGKGVHQEEEWLLRDIIRSVNKKIDYTAREGEGTRFTLRLKITGS
jgi:hypothetical protein